MLNFLTVRVRVKIINKEWLKVNDWFKSNKLPLNVNKTKYTLFLKYIKVVEIPLKLQNLLIKDYVNNNIKRHP